MSIFSPNTKAGAEFIRCAMVATLLLLCGVQYAIAKQKAIVIQKVQSMTCIDCNATYKTTKDYVALVTARRFVSLLKKQVKYPLARNSDELAVSASLYALFSYEDREVRKDRLDEKEYYLVRWNNNSPSWVAVDFSTYISEWQAYFTGDFVSFFNEDDDLFLIAKKSPNAKEFQIFITKYKEKNGVKGFYLNPRTTSSSITDSQAFDPAWLSEADL